MSLYNLSKLREASDLGNLAKVANDYSGGALLGGGSLAVFFILLLVLTKSTQNEFSDNLLVSSFASFVLSSMLYFGGLINIIFVFGYLTILIFTSLYVWIVRD